MKLVPCVWAVIHCSIFSSWPLAGALRHISAKVCERVGVLMCSRCVHDIKTGVRRWTTKGAVRVKLSTSRTPSTCPCGTLWATIRIHVSTWERTPRNVCHFSVSKCQNWLQERKRSFKTWCQICRVRCKQPVINVRRQNVPSKLHINGP